MSHEAFDFINYTFIFFLVISIVLFLIVTFFSKHFKLINWVTVVVISFIFVVVSMLDLIVLGYAADEINLEMYENSYLFIAIVLLSVVNIVISYRKR
ncbi:hypothetical protein [Jeotgalibacillus marinus]|uniref:3-isopropylmalate dehydrogenase n=1 Tax=Jeotgalibacillus marinus TaxID=86667 RepID=A0ABV3Q0R3_9BACL